jgi:protein gp37
MGKTKIEWTGKSWNPLRARRKSDGKVGHFCVKVSAGCKGCYAERQNGWTGTHVPYALDKLDQVEVYVDADALRDPLRWRKPTMIFPCSMTDLFADFYTDEMIDQVMAVMALCSEHTFQILTKRPERMLRYMLDSARDARAINDEDLRFRYYLKFGALGAQWPLPNVWLGVSVENQAAADERIPILLKTPAVVRWISAEPLLGLIKLPFLDGDCSHPHLNGVDQLRGDCKMWKCQACEGFAREKSISSHQFQWQAPLDWVVVGGESGAAARPMHPDWALSLRDQCKDAGVAFFFKQWGEWAPGACAESAPKRTERAAWFFNSEWDFAALTPKESAEMYRDDEPDVYRLGKHQAGRLLDGVEWSEYPVQTSAAVESQDGGGVE